MIDSEADMEKTEIKNGSEIYDTVRELLCLFGADSVQTVEFTDSSHGDSDIRHNYLIDRKETSAIFPSTWMKPLPTT